VAGQEEKVNTILIIKQSKSIFKLD